MQRHGVQIRLAALSVSAVMGCTDRGSVLEPIDGGPLAARSGSSNSALVSLSGGMNTANAQAATVGTDSRTRLVLYNSQSSFIASIDLTNTKADADAGLCTVKNNGGDLGQFLVQPPAGRNFTLEFDKTNATSTRHHLGVNWLESGIRIRVKLKGNIEGFPPLTVTTRDLGGGVTEYTYSGGAVNVERLVGGGVRQMDELFCLNRDTVVATVTR